MMERETLIMDGNPNIGSLQLRPDAATGPANGGKPAPAISLRNISKSYRLWKHMGPGLFSQLLRAFSGAPAIEGHPAARLTDAGFLALRNISFDVAPGESVGIIGRNGCGKSTLLQILAGILKPTTGDGTVNGEIATLLELGTGFHPDFTGRENISLNNAIMGVGRVAARERMERIEAFADIGRFMDEPIRTYSSGMMLRLGFACAVAVDPDVFLVDEALSVGDIFFQQKCYEFMRGQMSDKTRVIVSHDMQAITTFCSRVMVLEDGAVAFDGPPLQAVEYYMKALHDNQSGAGRKGANPVRSNEASPVAPAALGVTEWRTVLPDAIGGLGAVNITKTEVRVNDEPFASVVKPGDLVGVRMAVECHEAKSSILFGYLVRDKMGNAVFGENSAAIRGGVVAAEAGLCEAAFEFSWPEVQPGDYFLTLGIGEGRDPIRHRIQCWAHNLHLFSAISPAKAIHCVFNNPLRGFKFSTIAEATAQD